MEICLAAEATTSCPSAATAAGEYNLFAICHRLVRNWTVMMPLLLLLLFAVNHHAECPSKVLKSHSNEKL